MIVVITILNTPTKTNKQTKNRICKQIILKLRYVVQHSLCILVAIVCGLSKPFDSLFLILCKSRCTEKIDSAKLITCPMIFGSTIFKIIYSLLYIILFFLQIQLIKSILRILVIFRQEQILFCFVQILRHNLAFQINFA